MPSSPDTSSVSLTTPTNSKAINLVKPFYSDGILPATLSESSSTSGYSQDSQQTKISIDTVVFPAGKPALFKSSMTASIDNILSCKNLFKKDPIMRVYRTFVKLGSWRNSAKIQYEILKTKSIEDIAAEQATRRTGNYYYGDIGPKTTQNTTEAANQGVTTATNTGTSGSSKGGNTNDNNAGLNANETKKDDPTKSKENSAEERSKKAESQFSNKMIDFLSLTYSKDEVQKAKRRKLIQSRDKEIIAPIPLNLFNTVKYFVSENEITSIFQSTIKPIYIKNLIEF
ncbi:hypothetical protein B5S27_g5223 [[Candida] boidinii]|nr:hypothetical protein B5S27_g5223 [[Candida] boidinii]